MLTRTMKHPAVCIEVLELLLDGRRRPAPARQAPTPFLKQPPKFLTTANDDGAGADDSESGSRGRGWCHAWWCLCIPRTIKSPAAMVEIFTSIIKSTISTYSLNSCYEVFFKVKPNKVNLLIGSGGKTIKA